MPAISGNTPGQYDLHTVLANIQWWPRNRRMQLVHCAPQRKEKILCQSHSTWLYPSSSLNNLVHVSLGTLGKISSKINRSSEGLSWSLSSRLFDVKFHDFLSFTTALFSEAIINTKENGPNPEWDFARKETYFILISYFQLLYPVFPYGACWSVLAVQMPLTSSAGLPGSTCWLGVSQTGFLAEIKQYWGSDLLITLFWFMNQI